MKKVLTIVLISVLLSCSAFAAGGKPLSIVIMIGDGMGFEHVEAGRLYLGRRSAFEKYPVTLKMSTYLFGGEYDSGMAASDSNYVKTGATDSAAAATAMATGVKTYNSATGVDIEKKPLQNIIAFAESSGKSTGVITTVPFCDATPAGFVVHNISRYNYLKIAGEMIDESALEVIIGAGHPFYDSNGGKRDKPKFKYITAENFQSLNNGTAGGDCDGDGIADKWFFVDSRDEFLDLADGDTPKRVFGLAGAFSTLQQNRSGHDKAAPFEVKLNKNMPSLAELTVAGLNILDNDPDGFVLMVEGGAIDWAGHANQSGRMIEEFIDFNGAVEAVEKWAEEMSGSCDTLIIVTSDHETGYLIVDDKVSKPGVLPNMRWQSDGHTNSLVPFYAKGFGAEEFKKRAAKESIYDCGRIDNTDIAKVIFEILK